MNLVLILVWPLWVELRIWGVVGWCEGARTSQGPILPQAKIATILTSDANSRKPL